MMGYVGLFLLLFLIWEDLRGNPLTKSPVRQWRTPRDLGKPKGPSVYGLPDDAER